MYGFRSLSEISKGTFKILQKSQKIHKNHMNACYNKKFTHIKYSVLLSSYTLPSFHLGYRLSTTWQMRLPKNLGWYWVAVAYSKHKVLYISSSFYRDWFSLVKYKYNIFVWCYNDEYLKSAWGKNRIILELDIHGIYTWIFQLISVDVIKLDQSQLIE